MNEWKKDDKEKSDSNYNCEDRGLATTRVSRKELTRERGIERGANKRKGHRERGIEKGASRK